MHQHQQTLRDLEALNEPSAAEVAAYFVLTLATVACVLLFAFTF